jgi:hypothetical protein
VGLWSIHHCDTKSVSSVYETITEIRGKETKESEKEERKGRLVWNLMVK